MVDQIDKNVELLLSPEEVELFDRQVAAQKSADVGKVDADYQNEPNGDESCEACSMFVPGFNTEPAGYCTKVKSFNGPLGAIFPDGWCKFFQAEEVDDLSGPYAEALKEEEGVDDADDIA